MITNAKKEVQIDAFSPIDRLYVMQLIAANDGSKSPAVVSTLRQFIADIEAMVNSDDEESSKFNDEFWDTQFLNVMFDLENNNPSIIDCTTNVALMKLTNFRALVNNEEVKSDVN